MGKRKILTPFPDRNGVFYLSGKSFCFNPAYTLKFFGSRRIYPAFALSRPILERSARLAILVG
jgi:hypothetical protein